MLELQGIAKSFGQTAAVHPLSLSVPERKTTVLIGPSGCGKSTLLRLMLGLIPPTSGEVIFNGAVLTPQSLEAARQNIGYVIQDGGLFPHLTARENVGLLARHLGWGKDRLDARLDELADLTHFPPDGLDRYPGELSGGQQQRVALMRALLLDPPLLLMDEPLGALDPMIRRDLQDDLREIFRRLDKTVVMVTHDMDEAAFFGDLIVLMRDGRVEQQGAIGDLLERPASDFVTRFIRAQRSELPPGGGTS